MKIIKSKTQNELALQIVANYIIGKDAIYKASTGASMTVDEMTDALVNLSKNTISLLSEIVGMDGVKYYSNKYNLGLRF